ncbi:MAG: hypothetical protein Q7W02_00135 [Candidatus Rokubacteria bacterium]|nr:hypothetical protein [Candidatus Rokubacteria bacterium]
MTVKSADLVEHLAAVAVRLEGLPGRISGLVIGVQRLRGPGADPHTPRRRDAFHAEARVLKDEAYALSIEVGRLLETAQAWRPRRWIDGLRLEAGAASPVNPVRGPRIGRRPEQGGA